MMDTLMLHASMLQQSDIRCCVRRPLPLRLLRRWLSQRSTLLSISSIDRFNRTSVQVADDGGVMLLPAVRILFSFRVHRV
jgi:hypothetical protein